MRTEKSRYHTVMGSYPALLNKAQIVGGGGLGLAASDQLLLA